MERMALRGAPAGRGRLYRAVVDRAIGGLRGVLAFGLAGWIGDDEEQPRSQDDSVAQGAIRWPEVCSVLCSFEISLCVCVGSGWGQPANGPSYFRADVCYVCFIIWPALVWAKVTQRAF